MLRIYRTKFTRPGRLPRERRSMGRPPTVCLLRLFRIQGAAARGNAERCLEEARQKHKRSVALYLEPKQDDELKALLA